MAIAVIDIGTNTVLLLVAEINASGKISTLEYRQRVPRLGRGVDSRRFLQRDSMEGVVQVLLEFHTIADAHQPDVIAVCGTSAVRDAANRDEFAGLIKQKTGLDLEVLTGEEEALWTYRGAVSGIPGLTKATVVDIGGGSTELTTGTAQVITHRVSLDIGSVRLTERHLQHDPPLAAEIAALRKELISGLASLPSIFSREASRVVGVAGTATTLALLAQKRRDFDLQAIRGFVLRRETISHLVFELQSSSNSQILSLADYMEGRNDIITAGAIILEEVIGFLGAQEIIVSERGVRYGIAIREWEKRR